MAERWSDYWFAPQRPYDLAISRILFFGFLFVFYLREDFAAWGLVSDAFVMPIWAFEVFRIPILPAEQIALLQVVWKASLGLAAIGLFTRASTATSFVLGFYLLGLPHNFGKTHHFDAVLVLIFGVLSLSRCGDYLSVDRLLERGRSSLVTESPPSGEYRWPIRAVWVALALVFFAAGYAKLRESGLEWVFSDNLATQLVRHQYPIANENPPTAWGLYLARYDWMARSFAGGALLMEIGYPLAVVSRRLRWIFVPGMVAVLVGIRLLMGPTFEQLVICHVFWIPWGRWLGETS